MSILTTMKYKNYASRIIDSGEEFMQAATDLEKNIDKTIPKQFAGKTANKAVAVANEIAEGLRVAGINIRNVGYSAKKIVNDHDID